MAGIGSKIERDVQLQEFVERMLSYAFELVLSDESIVEDICYEMDITEDEMYDKFEQLGYDRDELTPLLDEY